MRLGVVVDNCENHIVTTLNRHDRPSTVVRLAPVVTCQIYNNCKGANPPVAPEQGDKGGLSTTANTPPAARDAATSAIMTISLVLNNLALEHV